MDACPYQRYYQERYHVYIDDLFLYCVLNFLFINMTSWICEAMDEYGDKCGTIVNLGTLQSKQDHEHVCENRPKICSKQGCSAVFTHKNLLLHESDYCDFRLVTCTCGKVMT